MVHNWYGPSSAIQNMKSGNDWEEIKNCKKNTPRKTNEKEINWEREREHLSRINYFFRAFGVKITQNSRNSCQGALRQFAVLIKVLTTLTRITERKQIIYNGSTLRWKSGGTLDGTIKQNKKTIEK